MNRWSKIGDALGLRRSIVGMLSMVILVGMGEKMSERFLPIYLIALGSGMFWPGVLNAVNNLVGALYAYPGGWLAERIGVKRSLLVFNLIAIAGYAIVFLIPLWQAVMFASLLFLSWTAISLPATMGLISATLPTNKQVMGVSMHSLTRRLPMALGPIVGGIFIDHWGPVKGVRLAFLGAIIMAVIALVMQQILIAEDQRPSDSPMDNNPWHLLRGFSPQLKNLFAADVLIRFCEQIPYAYVVLWCMRQVAGYRTAHVTATQFGILTAVEMATAVAIYLPVAKMADKSSKKPFVVITFINFALFPLVLFYSRTFSMLVVAFALRGLKEFGEPTRKALIMQLAPKDRKAGSFGAYYLFRDSVVALAAFAGAYLWTLNPAINLWSAFAFGMGGAIWFAIFGRDSSLSGEQT
ncbi:MAG: MFS transporter [Terracidiphilus sp.]|nr:MFS transporter [Terracidiphilus sp.]MDR3799100.1 MFS transporter [Terracidiphilus sp.]